MNAVTSTESSTIDTQHPWLGLASFTEETRQYFYGREEEVGELSRRVQRKLLTVLFGQSGLGKTSILNAGIVPRLRPEGYCPVYVRIDYGTAATPPSEQIKQAIFRATERQGTWTKTGAANEGESLWEFLHHRDDELLNADGKPIIPLLIFDQFEEIFTLAQADDAGRQRAATFIEDLADLVENRPPKALEAKIDADDSVAERFDFARADYRILISLREDYLAHLEGVKTAMPSITQNRMRLARMNGEQALAAVMKPGGRLVTQEVAESIVRFVSGGAELRNAEVEPSLLSLICRELNNARIAQKKNEISVDLLAGSNETILAEFYERALADQPTAVRKVIEDDLLTDSGYRENLAEERVLKAFTAAGAGQNNYADAATTLATLVNRRLLRIEERLDVRRVELTHDVLCGVVGASRKARLEREALDEADRQLLAQTQRAQVTRRALIRARQIAMGCAALSVAAIGSAIFGYFSTQRAHVAEAEAVKTRAVSETSRAEAEKLVVFIVDDFYEEMAPTGKLDVVGALAKKAVEYYQQLPPEARTAATQRNSALAQSRYAQVLIQSGKNDDATKLIDEAKATIKTLRGAGGSVADDTLITQVRVQLVEANNYANRNDNPNAIRVATEALALLKPLLPQPDTPGTTTTSTPITTATLASSARWLEAQLNAGLGYALLRSGQTVEAIAPLQQARAATRDLGALELVNLPVTTIYVRNNWVLGEALATIGRLDEAKTLVLETITFADKLLSLRPGHRPALAAKSTALIFLGDGEGLNLRVEEQLRYTRMGLRVQEEMANLDLSSGSGQHNLRGANSQIADALFRLGRIDESLPFLRASLAIGKNENIDGFAASQLVVWHGYSAEIATGLGDAKRAAFDFAEAQRYVGVMQKANASKRALVSRPVWIAQSRGWVALMGNNASDISAAQRELEAAMATFRPILTKEQKFPSIWAGWHHLAAQLALAGGAGGDLTAAGAHARKSLEFYAQEQSSALDKQATLNDTRALLALILARQGKRDEANKTLQPVLAFYRLPQVQKSDNGVLKAQYAYALLAAAVAAPNPSERTSLLAQAANTFDTMPPQLRRYRQHAIIREAIAREMGK